MHGTGSNLTRRLAVMTRGVVSYLNNIFHSNMLSTLPGKLARPHMAGVLAVYCGGCAMHVGSSGVGTVAEELAEAIPGVPFFGNFTFGEQGMSPDRTAFHGNLMFSLLVFTRRRVVAKVLNVETGEVLTEGGLQFSLASAVHPGLSELEAHTSKIREAGATIMHRRNLGQVMPAPKRGSHSSSTVAAVGTVVKRKRARSPYSVATG